LKEILLLYEKIKHTLHLLFFKLNVISFEIYRQPIKVCLKSSLIRLFSLKIDTHRISIDLKFPLIFSNLLSKLSQFHSIYQKSQSLHRKVMKPFLRVTHHLSYTSWNPNQRIISWLRLLVFTSIMRVFQTSKALLLLTGA